MPDDDKSAALRKRFMKLRKATESVSARRGRFLNTLVNIEAELDELVGAYFQPDEITQFTDWIVVKMSLRQKVKLLKNMLRSVGLADEYADLLRSINRLVEMRNLLAHEALDFVENTWAEEPSGYRGDAAASARGPGVHDGGAR